jgi:hypothetical protein
VPTLDDIYRKFGETAEAAQLLETQLGNMLLLSRGAEDGLFTEPNPELASDLFSTINRHTLGQLIKRLNSTPQSLDALESLFSKALQERNRLSHSFYRQHNFRRNSDEGRALMLKDIESIHDTLLRAYKAVMLLSGVDLDTLVESGIEHNVNNAPRANLGSIWRYGSPSQVGNGTMWTALLQAIGSFAAAAAAWIVLEFFGRPLRKFYDLRGETICLLAQTANVAARWKEIPDEVGSISGEVEALNVSGEQITDLKEAGKLLRDLASRFRAFAANETYALRFVRWRRYDPMKASGGLFGLSKSIDTYGASKAFHKRRSQKR